MPNRFFIWPDNESKPRPFEPDVLLPQLPAYDGRYFVRIAGMLPDMDATIFITWSLDRFDPVMQDAIIFLIGDERYQVPSYRAKVRAIFKTGGTRPNPLRDTLALPMSLSWRLMLRDARNLLLRERRKVAHSVSDGAIAAPIYELPLGYHALQSIDPLPIDQRPIDVFFAGGVSRTGWSARPSAKARKQMSRAMSEAQKTFPQYRIESIVKTTEGGTRLSPLEYTQRLANSKIALAPRGNFDETFRLFEAACLGCVIVTEPLPPRWYYDGCPAIEVKSWSELTLLLPRLLDDRDKLLERSRRTQQWWDATLSERAISSFVVARLQQRT